MKTIDSKCNEWSALTVFSCGIVIAGSNWIANAGETNELFLKNCAICHGKDGRADSAVAKKLGVKDLSQSRLTDSQIEQQIREGKEKTPAASKMPAFADRLTDEEIKALVGIVKEFRKPPVENSNQP